SAHQRAWPTPWTSSSTPTPATALFSSRTCPRAAWTSSPPPWCPCSRNAACSAPNTRAAHCANTSAWPATGWPREVRRRPDRGELIMARVPLSVLDLVPIPSGSTAADALRNSIDLARQAERFGYRRYWFAEHHLNP